MSRSTYGTRGGGKPGAFGSMFRPAHEYIFMFVSGKRVPKKIVPTLASSQKRDFSREGPSFFRKKDGSISTKINSSQTCGQPFRIHDSVIRLSPDQANSESRSLHPATFPETLPTVFIESYYSGAGLVVDPFAGSGTTVVAAKRLGVPAAGIEISGKYCDLASRRLETAHHQESLL